MTKAQAQYFHELIMPDFTQQNAVQCLAKPLASSHSQIASESAIGYLNWHFHPMVPKWARGYEYYGEILFSSKTSLNLEFLLKVQRAAKQYYIVPNGEEVNE